MSRIGKQPIPVPGGVTATIERGLFSVRGPKGELSVPHNPAIEVAQDGGSLNVTRPSDRQDHRALHGLTRSLVANAVQGVSNGFIINLE
ncbi:MAG: 50S ribosomal protein L6, partial [Deinococcus sp.]